MVETLPVYAYHCNTRMRRATINGYQMAVCHCGKRRFLSSNHRKAQHV